MSRKRCSKRNPILIGLFYSETTPESSSDGEHSDTGTISPIQAHTLEEAIDAIISFGLVEFGDIQGTDAHLYGESYTACFETGTEREESISIHTLDADTMTKIRCGVFENQRMRRERCRREETPSRFKRPQFQLLIGGAA